MLSLFIFLLHCTSYSRLPVRFLNGCRSAFYNHLHRSFLLLAAIFSPPIGFLHYYLYLTSLRSILPDSSVDDENDNYNNPKPLHLSLVDFTGLCVLSVPSRWIDLDKPVTAKVTLRDYTVPVVSMHLLLIRTEYIHDVSTDFFDPNT